MGRENVLGVMVMYVEEAHNMSDIGAKDVISIIWELCIVQFSEFAYVQMRTHLEFRSHWFSQDRQDLSPQ